MEDAYAFPRGCMYPSSGTPINADLTGCFGLQNVTLHVKTCHLNDEQRARPIQDFASI